MPFTELEAVAGAIAVGIPENTAMKLGASMMFGDRSFRRVAVPGLLAIGLATALARTV
jgi:hypothetical protein